MMLITKLTKNQKDKLLTKLDQRNITVYLIKAKHGPVALLCKCKEGTC